MAILRGMTASLLLLAVSGCHSVITGQPEFDTSLLLPRGGGPPPIATPAAVPAEAPQPIPPACLAYDDPQQRSKTLRNACIWQLKSDIDDRYRQYRIQLHHLVDFGNAAFDITSLGLSTAATATASAAAKTVLSAINTGVTGSKTALNEDLLYKHSIELLITQMDADRNEQFTVLLAGMDKDESAYSIDQAKNDLLVYFAAGTWDHALTSLQTKTSVNLANCQEAVQNAKLADASTAAKAAGCQVTFSGTYVYDDASKKLDAFWMPDGKSINLANQVKIRDCMKQNQIGGSIPTLIFGKQKTDDRNKVVGCLKL